MKDCLIIPRALSVAMKQSSPVPLTQREREVLQQIAAGRTSKQIAAALGISFKTVVCHRTRLMEKLDLHNVASLVRYAIIQQESLLTVGQDQVEQEYLEQLRQAQDAYRKASDHYNQLIDTHQEPMVDADGQHMLHLAVSNKHEALQRYAASLERFADLILGRKRPPQE